MSNMGEAIEEFIEKTRDNYAKVSRTTYAHDLQALRDYLGAERDITSITQDDIASFKESLKRSMASNSKRVSVTRTFFSWLYKEKDLAIDPARDLRSSLKRKELPRVAVLSYTEIRKIVDTRPIGTRDRAILELVAIGLKVSEINSLVMRDLGVDDLRVGSRKIKLNDQTLTLLIAYLDDERRLVDRGSQDLAIILGVNGYRMSRQSIWKTVKAASNGIVCPADIRRSYTAFLIQSGMSPHEIMQITGHRALELYTVANQARNAI